MARQLVAAVHLRLCVGHDHAVELQALGQLEVEEDLALLGQAALAVHEARGGVAHALAQLAVEPAGAAGVEGHHRAQPAFLGAPVQGLLQRGEVRLVVGALGEVHAAAGPAHRGHVHALLAGHERGEHGRDLRARAVARHELAGADAAALALKDALYLLEARRALLDGLVGVAEHEEARVAEVACEHHELGGRVVLHLVDNHELGGLVHLAGKAHLEVEPLDGREALLAQQAHADAVQAKPPGVLNQLHVGGAQVLHVAARKLGHVLLVVGVHRAAEHAVLLVGVHGGDLVLHGGAACQLRDAGVQLVEQVLLHHAAQLGPHLGTAREALHRLPDLLGAQQLVLAQGHVAHVLGLQAQRLEALVDAAQRLGGRVLAQGAVARAHERHELGPREGVGVLLAQVGQDVGDVLLEHRVGRHEVHLVGPQVLAVAEQQVGDALQQHRGLAAARHAAHQHRRDVLVADDGVLLLLDGGRDGLELRGALRGEAGQQQRVLDGHRGVEVALEGVALDVELAAQLQVGLYLAAVCPVGGGS